ncbi:hypothetical protein GF336_05205 [Candidatus Woesearchaeota archaeon]|nr:hypothetical protein [Candidatus Woesearchaeota archaeon]
MNKKLKSGLIIGGIGVFLFFIYFFSNGGISFGHYYLDTDFDINEAFPLDIEILDAKLKDNIITVKASLSPWKEDVENIYPIIRIYTDPTCNSMFHVGTYASKENTYSINKKETMVHISEVEVNFSRMPEYIGVRVQAKGDGFMGGSNCFSFKTKNA